MIAGSIHPPSTTALPSPPEHGTKPKPFRYRADIDALRGLAVLAVLVFHLNEAWLPGGFSGVDIFFVMSGYVVTGSLLSHASEPLLPRLGGFYLRRVRRLLPNLILTVGITSLLVALLVPPDGSRSMFLTAVKSLYGWSNNYLLGASKDYFALDTSLNPLLHTWSMGVEEQFYLLFPLLLAMVGMGRRRTLPLLAAATALSLAYSFWCTIHAPIAAFFLMPSRFWELTSGAILLLAQRRGLMDGWPRGRWLRGSGLMVILLALLFTSESGGFPLPGALPAVLGTLLMLQAGPEADGRFLPARWLERTLVAFGLLSYSLYLWHWPVITLMRWTIGMERAWQILLATALSFLLAYLAYRFVERPVRSQPLPGPAQVALALAALGGTWAGIDALAHPYRGQLFLGSTSDPVPRFEKIAEHVPVIAGTQITTENCAVGTGTTYSFTSRANYDLCGRPGRQGVGEIFLLGDSHAHHLLPMLGAVTEKTGHGISFTFKNSCLISPDLTISYEKKRYDTCRQFAAGEMERTLQRLRSGDIVLLSTWLNWQLGDIITNGRASDFPVYDGQRRLTPAEVRQSYVASTQRFARQLAERGIDLVMVVDIPQLLREPVECESWSGMFPSEDKTTSCAPTAEVTASMQKTVRDTLTAIAEGMDNVHVFDPTDLLLHKGKVQHRRSDGTILYSDLHHLSYSGSLLLAKPFVRFLRAAGLADATVSSTPTPQHPPP